MRWAQWRLKHRVKSVLAATAFFVGSFALVPLLPTGFLPPGDLSPTQVTISPPPGVTQTTAGVRCTRLGRPAADTQSRSFVKN